MLRLLCHHAGPGVRIFYADLKLTLVQSCKRVEDQHAGRDHSGTSAAATLPGMGQGRSPGAGLVHLTLHSCISRGWGGSGMPALTALQKEGERGSRSSARAPLLHMNFCSFSLASSYFTQTVNCCR